MKILLTTDTVGGVWQYSLTLAAALRQRDVAVALAVVGPPPAADQFAAALAVPGLDCHVYPGRLEWQPGCAADLAESAAWLDDLARRLRVDLIHSNQFAYGALRAGVPVIVVAHSDLLSWHAACDPLTAATAPAWRDHLMAYRAVVTAGLAGAAALVCPSHAMAADLAAHYAGGTRATVIYNGVAPAPTPTPAPTGGGELDNLIPQRAPLKGERELDDLTPHPPPLQGEGEIRSSSPPPVGAGVGVGAAGSAQRPLRVLSVGRLWDRAKGLDWLVEAVGPGLPGLEVAVAGDLAGPDGRGAARLPPGIRALGPLGHADLLGALARADLYVGLSRYEPFGLAPVEAALQGCALLLRDIPTFRELWGTTATYCGSAAAVRAALLAAAAAPALPRCAPARAARYSVARMAAAYLRLYDAVAGARGQGPGARGQGSGIGDQGSGVLPPTVEGMSTAT